VIGSWLVKIVVVIGVLGFAVIEVGSPLWTKAMLDSPAHDAAGDAAREMFQSHDPDRARQAAEQDAQDAGARLDRFSVDEQGRIHVTLFKRAKSYLLHKFSQTRHWYDVRVSASASATS
jgi:hypothetical protein